MNEPPVKDCLSPTRFIDCGHPSIQAKAHELAPPSLPPVERAVRLFDFVRDRIQYEFKAKLQERDYVASNVLACGTGFCVQKAVLLCALARAAGIPAAVMLTDLRDHTLPPKLAEGMGTNVLYHHGLVALYLKGRWVKADASLSPDLVEKKGYRQVVFDGREDALLAATTLNGEAHADYLRWHGMYADLPFAQMVRAFGDGYRGGNPYVLELIGVLPPGSAEPPSSN
ncbi:MAG: transglutaminase domain-containing protein [Phycisphaerales bacterium]|nr:MAG: transglutaminase domain-containing protein [Phycisphaerales bacterium]